VREEDEAERRGKISEGATAEHHRRRFLVRR
jgi:hypothetical protein